MGVYLVREALSCGSGTFAKVVTEKGHQVVGVDFSAAMVAIARHNAPKASFHIGSVYDFDIPKCDVVTAIGEVFNYNFDGKSCMRTHSSFKQSLGFTLAERIACVLTVNQEMSRTVSPASTKNQIDKSIW